jgi:dCTP deaminase
MILGNDAIKAALDAGHIVCNPAPDTAAIQTHIDVHLGAAFWVPRPNSAPIDMRHCDPHDYYMLLENCTEHDPVILSPGGFALAHTDEYVGTTVPWLEPHLETRSTVARWGITVHVSAGIGDAGYCSRWTLELYNHNNVSIRVYAGLRIGLIKFYRVESNTAIYTGRYNTPATEWQATAMLPRRGNV